ncbi:MAG TPA: mechanosensitive ion channel family protein [Chitinophagaceae bacterium]|nr:mechanosensitive ion channel family protein [Chitinophagaceae bacterium]
MKKFYDTLFLGNSLRDWMIASGILVVSLLLIRLLRAFGLRFLRRWSQKTETTLDDFLVLSVEKQVIPFLYVAAVYGAATYLSLTAHTQRVLDLLMLLAATFFVLRLITAAFQYAIFLFLQKQENPEQKKKQSRGLILIISGLIWIVGIVFLLDNLGYNVTTIITGLGIGGIAIALAAQTILGDLFSYFVIFFDRPFEIGDFIAVDDKSGTVEYIGVKTTRLRSISGEQLICANKYLTDSRIHNYKRMERRRIVFRFGVVYQTSADQLQAIPRMVKAIIEKQGDVLVDRGHFTGFGDFSLNFEFVYYVLTADYTYYMDRQQAINLEIVRTFAQQGIEFAYPTQTILVQEGARS